MNAHEKARRGLVDGLSTLQCETQLTCVRIDTPRGYKFVFLIQSRRNVVLPDPFSMDSKTQGRPQ